MLKVYTAQYRYKGPNRIDVTVKGAKPPWDIFAPTWDMVNTYIHSPRNAAAEADYIRKYNVIVANAYTKRYKAIMNLVNSDETRVLVCFCTPGTFCHRVLLARQLEELGAEYIGEI